MKQVVIGAIAYLLGAGSYWAVAQIPLPQPSIHSQQKQTPKTAMLRRGAIMSNSLKELDCVQTQCPTMSADHVWNSPGQVVILPRCADPSCRYSAFEFNGQTLYSESSNLEF